MTTRQMKPQSSQALAEGVGVISTPDLRWNRCDIKSVSLLPNVLGKQEAVEAGAYEAWMVDPQGRVTEGTSTNAWIVTQDNELVTRDASTSILNGITRLRLLDLIRQDGITFSERAFSIDEARQAREAFITSSSNFVMPVTRIDGQPVGNGHPGLLTGKLREAYLGFVQRQEESA
jgi:D-alanine transaminase